MISKTSQRGACCETASLPETQPGPRRGPAEGGPVITRVTPSRMPFARRGARQDRSEAGGGCNPTLGPRSDVAATPGGSCAYPAGQEGAVCHSFPAAMLYCPFAIRFLLHCCTALPSRLREWCPGAVLNRATLTVREGPHGRNPKTRSHPCGRRSRIQRACRCRRGADACDPQTANWDRRKCRHGSRYCGQGAQHVVSR